MKKTFVLTDPKIETARLLEAVRRDVKRYVKRERNKKLPEGVDFWDFDCKFGDTEDSAKVVHLSDIKGCLDDADRRQLTSFYVEILVTARNRKPDSECSGRAGTSDQIMSKTRGSVARAFVRRLQAQRRRGSSSSLYPLASAHKLLGGPSNRWVYVDYGRCDYSVGDQGDCNGMIGTYRVEVISTSNQFLTLIQAKDAAAVEDAAELIDGTNMRGAIIDDAYVVMFGETASAVTSASFTVPTSSSYGLLLVDLQPSAAYSVTTAGQEVTVSLGGLHLTSEAGTLWLAQ